MLPPGFLMIGGHSYDYTQPHAGNSVEFWSPDYLYQKSCVLSDYPREMGVMQHVGGPTVNIVAGRLITCYNITCEIYNNGNWQHLQDTLTTRQKHTSAVFGNSVLLIGGDSNTTELIPVDGSPAQPGPFTIRHGARHCTIQVSSDVIVITGGDPLNIHNEEDWYQNDNFVTAYHLTDGKETPLSPLVNGRVEHACGVYQNSDGHQVIYHPHYKAIFL